MHRDPGLMTSNLTSQCPAQRQKFAALSYSRNYPIQLRERDRHRAAGFTTARVPSRGVQRKCWNKGCV